MSDDRAVSSSGGGAAIPTRSRLARPGSNLWRTLRSRAMELVIVFAGVYAAFLLNRLDTERHDAKRRTQIVGALEREITENVEDFKNGLVGDEKGLAEFDRQLAAGEMPHLNISYMNSGYSDSDDATLLQAGGLDLLDVQTVELLRKVNTLQRGLLSAMHNHFEVCLTELANHHSEDFYDPATRQLKPQYQWYPLVLHNLMNNAKALLAAEEALLTQLRSTRPAGAPGQR